MRDTVHIESGDVRMIAHRGLSGIETENTAAAFVAAANRSYFGIETDIHVTKDGFFAVIHDDKTSRVSSENLTVEESTLAELRAVQLRNKECYPRYDLRIPALEEYVSICKTYGKTSVLELKNLFTEHDISHVIGVLKEMEHLESTIFISFVFDNLVMLRKLEPSCRVQWLVHRTPSTEEMLKTAKEHRFDLDLHFSLVTPELVSTAHEYGLLVNTWTVDAAEEAERLIDAGIDFITTNILE